MHININSYCITHTPRFIMSSFLLSCELGDYPTAMKNIPSDLSLIKKGFEIACQYGHMNLVKQFRGSSHDLSEGLGIACKHNQLQVAQYLLSEPNAPLRLENVLYQACVGGNMWIIKLIMKHYISDYNFGLMGACVGGHSDVVQLMINHGANQWPRAMFLACSHGKKSVIDCLIANGAKCWNHGLQGACLGGYIDIVQMMIQRGADDWDNGLISACEADHFDENVVELMIKKGANDFDEALNRCCCWGHLDGAQKMIEKGAKDGKSALWYAVNNNHFDLVVYIACHFDLHEHPKIINPSLTDPRIIEFVGKM